MKNCIPVYESTPMIFSLFLSLTHSLKPSPIWCRVRRDKERMNYFSCDNAKMNEEKGLCQGCSRRD